MEKGTGEALKHLGRISNAAVSEIDVLAINRPVKSVTLHCSEFTSRCPVTGQPDFGVLKIVYTPDGRIAETKSLKLYLQSFRERPLFNEEIVAQIAADLMAQLQPLAVTVTGVFNTRGGISVEAEASLDRRKDD